MYNTLPGTVLHRNTRTDPGTVLLYSTDCLCCCMRRLAHLSLHLHTARAATRCLLSSAPHPPRRGMSSHEVAAAQSAANFDDGAPTIFDKILDGSIPSSMVYEDDHVFCFDDIAPQAPTHVVCIPKVRDGLTGIDKAEARHESILGKLMVAARTVADLKGLDEGYRVVVNNGKHGAQSVGHIHVHLLGGRQLSWPPG